MSMLIDDDEMAVASSKEASRGVIREHLEDNLANNPRTSFAGWVSQLHPENVTVDPRLDSPGSEWKVIWEEITSGHGPEGSSCGCWQKPDMPNDEQPADVRGDIVGKGLVDHIVAVSLGVGMVAGIVMMCFLRFVMEKMSAMLFRASAKAGEAARSTTPASGKTADKTKYALTKILLTCAQMVGTAIAYSLKIGAIGTVVGEVLTRELVAVAAFVFCGILALSLEHAKLSRIALKTVAGSTRVVSQRKLDLIFECIFGPPAASSGGAYLATGTDMYEPAGATEPVMAESRFADPALEAGGGGTWGAPVGSAIALESEGPYTSV